ncbi:MAG: hypothetical protein LKF10_05760 [Eubacterium sp.]|jgi:hypothetical protein|nr:hypothetical protein [Eubacterium sp.]
MMPLLALGLVVFAALVYACVYRFTGEEKDDHQVIQFPSERKSRWKKLNTTSTYTTQKKDAHLQRKCRQKALILCSPHLHTSSTSDCSLKPKGL